MPIRLEASSDSEDQVVVFIEACRRAPWAAVTRIAVQRRKSDEYPARSWAIDHVMVEDPEDKKRTVAHPDPSNDIRQIVREVAGLVVKWRHKKAVNFIVYGHATKSVRGKTQIVEETELKLFDFPMHVGEHDGDEEEGDHDVSAAKVLAQAFKDSIAPFREQADMHRAERDWLWERMKEGQAQIQQMGGQVVEMARVTYEYQEKKEVRREAAEERAEERAAAAEMEREKIQAMERHAARGERLLNRWLPIVIANIKKDAKAASDAAQAASDAAPSSGSLVKDLRSLLDRIDAGEKAHLRKQLGETLWRLIEHAASVDTDEQCKAELLKIRQIALSDPMLGAKIFDTETLLGPERYATLFDILTRAGAFGAV